jgi:MFS family permease
VTYRALLLNRNFRFLWIGEAVSTFGNYFTRLAVPFFVWQLTGSYTQLGIARALPLFAALLFGLLTGALVDRWDRRRTMIYADLASGALLALLFVLMGQPLDVSFKVAALYAASFVAEILRSIFAAARVAIMPDVVRDDELLAANALDQSTTQFAEVVSYPLIGLALWVGPTLSFGVDAATFLLSALLLWRVAVPHTAPAAAPGNTIWADIGAGLRVTRQLPLVRRTGDLFPYVYAPTAVCRRRCRKHRSSWFSGVGRRNGVWVYDRRAAARTLGPACGARLVVGVRVSRHGCGVVAARFAAVGCRDT